MLLGARTGAALSGGAALSASLRIVTQASENNGVGHSSARSDAPSNAITASHCRRESRQQRKQRHFNPKIATRLGDGFVCRRDAGAPPLQERERWSVGGTDGRPITMNVPILARKNALCA